jgi:hypothetical protein
MEGREEAFEFRTAFDFDEAEFVEALNRSVPPGIVFTRLERVAPGSPKLNDRLAAMTYGLDLGADEVRAALAERRGERDLPASDADAVEQLAAAELDPRDPLLVDFRVDRGPGRLAFTIAHTNAKPLRPQDVIEKILGLKKSVYLLVRERIVYK